MGLRWTTAGEAHGEVLIAVLEGIPLGLPISEEVINRQLDRRRSTCGRGPRMKNRVDKAKIIAGVVEGVTIGAPIAIAVGESAGGGTPPAEKSGRKSFSVPRPGHADLAGGYKYGTTDLYLVWERASARETAARVAAGAVCRELLHRMGVGIDSFTTAVGSVKYEPPEELRPPFDLPDDGARCPDSEVDSRMCSEIERAGVNGDSLGGRCRVIATGLPPGIGHYDSWDRRLGTRVAAAMMSIPSVKGVLIGDAEAGAESPGSSFLDPIEPGEGRPIPAGNSAGGIEGGMTTGLPITVELLVKPVPTLGRPLDSVDLRTGGPAKAPELRSDICVVPAVGIIAEAMLAFELCRAVLDQFGGDRLDELIKRVDDYRRRSFDSFE